MAIEFPPIYLLTAHLSLDQLHEIESQIPSRCLTYDISEAKVVIGKVATKQRAQFELRSRKLWTEEVGGESSGREHGSAMDSAAAPPTKRRRVDLNTSGKEAIVIDSSTESEPEANIESVLKTRRESIGGRDSSPALATSSPLAPVPTSSFTSLESQAKIIWGDTIKVLKLSWFTDSLKSGALLPFEKYLVYEGRPIPRPEAIAAKPKITRIPRPASILSRANADAPRSVQIPFSRREAGKPWSQSQTRQPVTRPTQLLHQSTSEHDSPAHLPPIPSYMHTTYSCQRPTPLYSPNDPFICQLKKIKTARLLNKDDIGVRAYSSSIATLAAYPYTLTSVQEVMALPGCDKKIAMLYQEWKDSGHIEEVDEISSDPKMQVLNLFYEIWGVGATTAREFYRKGWRDLDDIVEYGWDTISRVQQIGLKFYDEFQEKIPRTEVEAIGATILAHAEILREGFQMVIVGGHRRGKPSSGDVDVILSHPDEDATDGFVTDIVSSLEKGQWITHTLILSTKNSERGQTPVSWKGDETRAGSGFDTLDKALVVWQNPEWPSKAEDLKENPKAKNPNIHRRVDIIISPWKTAGCAVLGWSGGTTFQRDLRRYCKKVKNLKFDSSGVRSREDGKWVDVEFGAKGDMLDKEKKVFQALGLEYRDPTERCTG